MTATEKAPDLIRPNLPDLSPRYYGLEDRPGVEIELVYVTPEMAQGFLQGLDEWQRPRKPQAIKRYASDMKNGRWFFAGDPFRFSDIGTMLDGRNRSEAIVESGKAQWIVVITGLPRETYHKMDQGKPRSNWDILAARGHKYPRVLARVARICMDYEAGNLAGRRKVRALSLKPSADQVIHWVESNKYGVEQAKLAIHYANQENLLTAPDFGAFKWLTDQVDPERSAEFWEGVAYGTSAEKDSPILRLRRRLIKGRVQAETFRFTYRMAIVIKMWNSFLYGYEVKSVHFNPEKERFPELLKYK